MNKYRVVYVPLSGQDEEIVEASGFAERHDTWIDFYVDEGTNRATVLRVRADDVARVELVRS